MKAIKGFLSLALFFAASPALAGLRVVTTTEDLAALAREVGGEGVDVQAIARGYQDPHFVEAKPSHLLKLRKADLFVQVGLELEVGWAPVLLAGARNPKILPGTPGFLDASEGCDVLQVLGGKADRSQGDVHPFGNPHYWLDPANGRVIARNIAERLAMLDPGRAEAYRENLRRFEARLSGKEKAWDAAAASWRGVRAVTYHNSWPNFARRFGVEVVDFVEPKPGVPPSPAHLRALMEKMRKEGVALLFLEPYFETKLPEKIARETGAALVVFPPSVGAEEGIKTYADLFDRQLALIQEALASGKRP